MAAWLKTPVGDLAGITSKMPPQVQQKSLALLQTLGYTICATETVVTAAKIHTLRPAGNTFPPSSTTTTTTSTKKRKRTTHQEPTQPIHVLKRVTIEVNKTNDFDLIGSTQSKTLEQFDLVAALPTTEEAFTAACSREDHQDSTCLLPHAR